MTNQQEFDRLDYDIFRRDFKKHSLSKSDVNEDPLEQFKLWFDAFAKSGMLQPNAMTLSTASKTGDVLSRTILLKHIDGSDFIFVSNYDSQKGKHLDENPKASLLFFCMELERQIIVTGSVKKTSKEESSKYFHSRPYKSQLAAYSSEQSKVVDSREFLENQYRNNEEQFSEESITCPSNWGGYRFSPESFEFWQGRANRLHDRIRYRKHNGNWAIERLAP